MTHKTIITCAVTGSVHTPTMSPHLPCDPREIGAQSVAAAQAGAAILHIHTRDPADGRPSHRVEHYEPVVAAVYEATDAVLNLTTGGGLSMTREQRHAAAKHFSPEMASCNMGSMNFGIFGLASRYPAWQHSWEPDHLEASRHGIFSNTFADIERLLEDVGSTHGTKFEFECYDVGHLYNLAHFLERGLVRGPLFVQFALGILGGISADPENLMHMKRTADSLFGDRYQWSVLAAGRHQLPTATMAALLGGHVRVGLEDSLYLERGKLATSNAEQVATVRDVLERLGLEIATPDEARRLLGLKGRSDPALARENQSALEGSA